MLEPEKLFVICVENFDCGNKFLEFMYFMNLLLETGLPIGKNYIPTPPIQKFPKNF